MKSGQVNSTSSERQIWQSFQSLVEDLNRMLVFKAATNGRMLPDGIALPDDPDNPVEYFVYSWDEQRDRSSIMVLNPQREWRLHDGLNRCWLMLQAIRLLKSAAGSIERWASANKNPALPTWKKLTCGQPGCYLPLDQHEGPDYRCPAGKRMINFVMVMS